ncbi:MAG: hypothetical protein ACREON_06590, partial [Gemmatimonadaceae bacterium]
PRRLTDAGFVPFELAPAWSPDGRWIAFTSWDDTLSGGGHLWKVPARGGRPVRLTSDAGEYINPAWRSDGRELVLARGAGETNRGRGMVWNAWWDVVRVPSTGGRVSHVYQVRGADDGQANALTNIRNQIVRPSYGPDGRIFFPVLTTAANGTITSTLVSVRPDGSDRRSHLTFAYADEVMPSPDGKWVAFQQSDNVYLTPFPYAGTGSEPPRIDRRRGKLPVTQLSREGGLFPRWRDARTLEFGSGTRYFAHRVDPDRLAAAPLARADSVRRARTDTVAVRTDSIVHPDTAAAPARDSVQVRDTVVTERSTLTAASPTDTAEIRLAVPADVPSGTIALINARIITLANRRVIDRGTVVVRRGRITCVGECATTGADSVVDLAGATIVPGFIDVHSHNFREHRGIIPQHNYETAIFLAYGVTSTMDPSMWSQNIFPTAEMTDAGLIVGSRVFSTGDPLYAWDGSRQEDMSSYEVAEASINRLASWGAVSLKQYLQPRRDQRQWVTDIARKRGLMVTAENNELEYVIGMLMDGHTGFEHPMSYVPMYGDLSTFIGKANAVYSPTFMVGGPGPWNEEYF